MTLPKVSIIIPAFRQAKYLPDAIRSATDQRYSGEVDVIVVAGDDECESVGRSLKVPTLRDAGICVADARNLGISRCCGTYCICLDADDMLDENYVAKCIAEIEVAEIFSGNGSRFIVSTNMREFGLRQGYWDLNPGHSQAKQWKTNNLTCASLFSKDLWLLAGGYDASLVGYEDWDFFSRASAYAHLVTHVPERLLRYRVHAEQSTNAKTDMDDVLKAMIFLNGPWSFTPGEFDRSDAIRACSKIAAMNDNAYGRVCDRLDRLSKRYPPRLGDLYVDYYKANGKLSFYKRLADQYRSSTNG